MTQVMPSDSIGWKWFEYHAKQRLELFKFYLTIYAGTIGLGVAALDKEFMRASFFLGCLGIFLTVVFWLLDRRARKLIEIGEKMLEHQCRCLGVPDEMNPIKLAAMHTGGLRLKYALGFSFASGALMGVALAIASLAVLLKLELPHL